MKKTDFLFARGMMTAGGAFCENARGKPAVHLAKTTEAERG